MCICIGRSVYSFTVMLNQKNHIMKKQLLKISLLLMCLVGGIANAQTCDEIKLFYKNSDGSKGAEIADDGDVQLGSTIKVELTTSSDVEGKIIFMQLAGTATWVKTYSQNSEPTIPQGNSQQTAFDFDVKADGNAEVGASFFKVVFKDVNNDNIGTGGQKPVTFTEAAPTPDGPTITSGSYVGQPYVQFGTPLSYTVEFSYPDDGNEYKLGILQTNWLEGEASAKWVQTNKVVLTGETSPYSGTYNVVTQNNSGVNCVDGVGNISFVLFVNDGNGGNDAILNDTKIQIQTTFSTTPTSIGRPETSAFKVYPNPASSHVFVEAAEGSLVEICNVAGSVVKSLTTTSSKQNISVVDLAKGMYVLKVTTDGKAQTTKLLVK